MVSRDRASVARHVRRAYELTRVKLALIGVLPVAAIVALAAVVGHRPVSAVSFGVAVVGVAAAMLWYGREPQRAVLPGVAAGLVPLTLALCSGYLDACDADGCSSWCIPACALGGVVAGLAVASVGNERRAGPWFWLSASSIALLTGAMGCSCVGYSGVVGLTLGLAAGMVPGVLRRVLGEKLP